MSSSDLSIAILTPPPETSSSHPSSLITVYLTPLDQLTERNLTSLLTSSAHNAFTLESADPCDPLIYAIDILTHQLATLAGYIPLDPAELDDLRAAVRTAKVTLTAHLETVKAEAVIRDLDDKGTEELYRLAWGVAFLQDREEALKMVAQEVGSGEFWAESVLCGEGKRCCLSAREGTV